MNTTENKTSLSVTNLRCEYKVAPVGIDVLNPRMSWQINSAQRDISQSAYQIRVAEGKEALAAESGHVWDSGKVASDESIHRVYDGPTLKSGQRCYWHVRI